MNVATINLKLYFFPDNSFFQVHSHFSRIFNKIIKFQYFSRTGKTVVIFPGAVGTLTIFWISSSLLVSGSGLSDSGSPKTIIFFLLFCLFPPNDYHFERTGRCVCSGLHFKYMYEDLSSLSIFGK